MMAELEELYEYSMKKSDYLLFHKQPIQHQNEIGTIINSAASNSINKEILKNVLNATKDISQHIFIANSNLQKAISEILASIQTVFGSYNNIFNVAFEHPVSCYDFYDKMILLLQNVHAKLVNYWPRIV
jgi:hypothetical protein